MEDDADFLSITPLGSGNEVGRSCHILQFKGKTIMLDCGIHPAGKGIDALPYFDQIDADQIDLILISHFHLDHAAALPYFLAQTNFKGRVFMTHPTKSIYKLILQDFVKVSAISAETALYDEDDLINSMDKIEAVNFHQVVHYKGIKFWCYHAGHVLGAAMFMIEIAGVKVLYTGDYSRREDRHLMAAEIPSIRPDVLIVESTWGIRTIPPINEREKRFTDLAHQVLARGGRVLIPVFALGRAQELLLILDEYWDANPSLHSYPIYYASALAKKCMTVYKRYVNMMNNGIRSRSELGNPFNFRHILNLKGIEQLDDIGPSIVMASPGMLQNGLSRQLFEMWCSDKRNAVILAGYSVEGTLAKLIQNEPDYITTLSGLKIPLNMSVHEISFSAHADFTETSEFIATLRPRNIVLVHGESSQMLRLRQELMRIYDDGSITVIAPKNCQQVELEFKSERIAKVVGTLAARAPYLLSGLVVRRDFTDRIMAVEDLPVESALSHTIITQNLKVPFRGDILVAEEFLGRVYSIEKETVNDEIQLLVMGDVRVSLGRENKDSASHISLEWCSNPVTDMIADSVICILLSIDTNVASARILSTPCSHHNSHQSSCKVEHDVMDAMKASPVEEIGDKRTESCDHDRHKQMQRLLGNIFESVVLETEPMPNVCVKMDDHTARVFLEQFDVFAGDDEEMCQIVEPIASRAHAAVYPIAPVTTVDELMEDYNSGKRRQQVKTEPDQNSELVLDIDDSIQS